MITRVRSSNGLSPGESQWHDLLRLVLLAQVVLGHFAAIALPIMSDLLRHPADSWVFIGYKFVTRFGPQAAFLFVFLSGFMVAGPLIRQIREGQVSSWGVFVQRRSLRLLPIAVIAIAMTAVLDYVARLVPGATFAYANSYAGDMTRTFTPEIFAGNLLFTQPILVPAFGSNGPLWTLGYLFQYYIIGWVVSRIAVWNKLSAGAVLLLLLAGMLLVRPEWGVLFCVWLVGGVSRLLLPLWQRPWFGLTVGLLLFVASNATSPLVSAVLAAPAGFFLTQSFQLLPTVTRTFAKPLRTCSGDSFAVYVLHHPIIMAVYATVFRDSAESDLQFLCFVLVSLVAIALCSAAAIRAQRWVLSSISARLEKRDSK